MNRAVFAACFATVALCMGGQSPSGPPYKVDESGRDPNDLLKGNPSEMHFDL